MNYYSNITAKYHIYLMSNVHFLNTNYKIIKYYSIIRMFTDAINSHKTPPFLTINYYIIEVKKRMQKYHRYKNYTMMLIEILFYFLMLLEPFFNPYKLDQRS